ncbi:hypothetical protein ACFWNQ_06660 [Streptomyces virginiae]|uniref:aromatic-ring hydroxylase C-terminal domain-containing protein n=1 Tax=Streptomyces virginiae TaxID=1961 RepID=UPI0036472D5B
MVGRSAPDLELADGTRLADLLHDGRALLLDLADDAELRARAEGYGERVRLVTTAWAVDAGDAPESGDGLGDALSRWFGAPDRPAG